ncbi:MAG: glycosyltransferase family 39 protein [Anaerolineaceae bacterium]
MKAKSIVSQVSFWVILCAMAVAGFLLIQYSTPIGLGLTNDSSSYLSGARNILTGDGYTRISGKGEYKPITHFPPGYSLSIAVFSKLGLEAQRAARLENILLFSFTMILSSIILWRMTGSKWYSLLGALFVFTSQVTVYSHIFLLSEPLFLFVSGLALLCAAIYIENKKWIYLFAAGLLTCFSYLTRYVGLAVYVTIILALLVLLPEWKQKIRSSLVFLLISLPGTVLWSLRNMSLSLNPTNRNFIYHPINPDEIHVGLTNFWSFFLPNRWMPRNPQTVGWILGLVGMGVLIFAGVIFAWSRYKREDSGHQYKRQSVLFMFGLYSLAYMVMLFISMTFFDSSTKFELRILVPALLTGALFLLGWLGQWVLSRSTGMKFIVIILLVGLFVSMGLDLRGDVRTYHEDGQGFLAMNWRISKSLAYIKTLPEDQVLYSNRSTVIYLLTGRTAYVLPTPVDDVTQQPRPDYQSDLENLRQDVQEGARIVIFYPDDLDQDWIAELTQGMQLIERTSDGIVFAR